MNEEVKTALIIGVTSDVGRAIALKLAQDGWALQLAGRGIDRVEREAQDIRIRSQGIVTSHCCNVLKEEERASLVAQLNPLPNAAVCVVGLLGNQVKSERNGNAAERVMLTNYVGPVLLMGAIAQLFEERGSGILVGISSVAGDRGRADNYVYGSAKAGFTAFLSGLRNRLAVSGVRVVTVKPGFVRTRMTAAMDLPAWLTAEPEEVADAVVKAMSLNRNVIYVRRVWRLIMLAVRSVPECIFKWIKL